MREISYRMREIKRTRGYGIKKVKGTLVKYQEVKGDKGL